MSKKNIITLVVGIIIMAASGYFIYTLLFPNKTTNQNNTSSTTNSKNQNISVNFDDKTFKSINTLSDYGKPALSGIGKSDLFAAY